MILTAHQPVYLPWLGLFHKIALSDTYVFFDQVQYLPKDWMNRNKINSPNGEIWLTVPVLRKGHRELKTSEIQINNETDWRKKHLRSILMNYKKSEYFDEYFYFFENVYGKKWEYLSELNEYMLKWFLNELEINVEFLKASDLDFDGKKSLLVLDMCKKLKADTYIFGELGKNYVDENSFENENINLIFQNYQHPSYNQLSKNFISHLSIIDVLFNHGPKSLEIIMSGNITKNNL
tara:strand:- start:3346 stop:4050 length:705 start_codon:yes stop_codon:yes gene_type:complete